MVYSFALLCGFHAVHAHTVLYEGFFHFPIKKNSHRGTSLVCVSEWSKDKSTHLRSATWQARLENGIISWAGNRKFYFSPFTRAVRIVSIPGIDWRILLFFFFLLLLFLGENKHMATFSTQDDSASTDYSSFHPVHSLRSNHPGTVIKFMANLSTVFA